MSDQDTTTTQATPSAAAPSAPATQPAASPAPASTPPADARAPGTGAEGQQSGSTPGVSPEYRQISVDEYEKLVRNGERVAGMQSLIDPLVKAKITDPGAVSRLANFHQKASELGVDPERLLDVFRAPQGAETPAASEEQTTAGLTAEQVNRLLDERDAKAQHTSAMRDQDSFFDSLAARLAGEGADPKYVGEVRDLIETKWSKSAQLYPEGHALRGVDLRPLTAQERSALEASVTDSFRLLRAQDLAARGQAAGGSVPTGSPASGATGSQTPTGQKPWSHMTQDEKVAYYKQRSAAIAGGPTSQVVG